MTILNTTRAPVRGHYGGYMAAIHRAIVTSRVITTELRRMYDTQPGFWLMRHRHPGAGRHSASGLRTTHPECQPNRGQTSLVLKGLTHHVERGVGTRVCHVVRAVL